ncbi:hypothetical protein IWW36_000067 [Coemansia brasiliensis]|uniref:Uncharacterized protein n=1 Tax=Coemansia brasiliensis TaxID=2650707 RepID=A0A9W8IBV7_9FUNG|nr:hypothetical protein IWW36_000067 [Coemansia brasiliensis]
MNEIEFSRLIFLGDSNADNGNVWQLTRQTHPQPSSTYWHGRYSNGKVWADYLAELIDSEAINLAYGCATIDNSIVAGTVPMPDGQRVEVPSLMDQINILQSRVRQLSSSDLVFVQVGSNDLNSLVDTGPLYRRKCEYSPQKLAKRLGQAVRHLCTKLDVHNVVVMNVRPREDYPAIVALKSAQLRRQTLRDTAQFNQILSSEVAQLQDELGPKYHLLLFDTYTAQKKIALVTDPQTGKLVSDPDLFIDGCHLGSRAQKEIYVQILDAITSKIKLAT